jgi:hypothetical protein
MVSLGLAPVVHTVLQAIGRRAEQAQAVAIYWQPPEH